MASKDPKMVASPKKTQIRLPIERPCATPTPLATFLMLLQREMVENLRLFVLHITDGSPSVQNAAERFAAFKSWRIASFLIGQGGEIYQFVQLEDIAWHAKVGTATALASSTLRGRQGS